MIKSTSARIKLLALAMFVILGTWIAGTSHAFNFRRNPIQQDSLLTNLAIRPDQLPGGSEWIEAGPVSAADVTQPLNISNERIVQSVEAGWELFSYQTAYRVEALVPSGDSAVHIGNYLFRYSDSREADRAATILRDFALSLSGSPSLQLVEPSDQEDFQGQVVTFVGAEGDTIQWFIDTRGEVLVLLTGNSIGNPFAEQTFVSLIGKLSQNSCSDNDKLPDC